MTAHGNITHCGAWFEQQADASAHEATCRECADVVDTLEGELIVPEETQWAQTLAELAGIE